MTTSNVIPYRTTYIRAVRVFDSLVKNTVADLAPLVTTIPTSIDVQTYEFMGMFPDYRKWLGAREVKELASHKYQITNDEYELTIGLNKSKVDAGDNGYVDFILTNMATRGRQLPIRLLTDKLIGGEAADAETLDGQAFFDTDHPVSLSGSAGTQSNYFTGRALTPDNFAFVRLKMRTLKQEDGQSAEILPSLLIVPPELEEAAKAIVEPDLVSIGGVITSNPNKGAARILVLPRLSIQPTAWYLADTTDGIRPLILQEQQAPRLTPKDKDTDDNVFWHRQYIWGSDAKYGAGYGAWQKLAKAVA
jgi:phage major head subunit gpT-like protein